MIQHEAELVIGYFVVHESEDLVKTIFSNTFGETHRKDIAWSVILNKASVT